MMRWRYLPIWLVLAGSVLGPTSQPAATTKSISTTAPTKTVLVQNKTLGFSIELPSDLVLQEPRGGTVLQAAEELPEGQPLKTAEIITISVANSPPEATLEAHYVQTVRDMAKVLELFDQRAFGYARIGGCPAFRLEYHHRIGADHHLVRLVGILAKPRFFLISCSVKEDAFGARHERFEKVIGSFRLSAPASQPTSTPVQQP